MEFRFKIQPYQTEATKAVTDVFIGQPNMGAMSYLRDVGQAQTFKGMESIFGGQQEANEGYGNAAVALDGEALLTNIRAIQRRREIRESLTLCSGTGACSLDVEMETGTGKTYVYTKTMYELNRLYGWTKFVIVVPSVAIREGIMKSLEYTEQHFFEQYGKSIKYFIYNSKHLSELDSYSQSPDINVMIINMQAFNTSMKENGTSKEARIMYSERDEFGSRRPIDVLAANHPIIIQDEPQKMGGKATQDGIKRFQPLFCLNYSATHKDKHDTVYVLDALDAYNQRLVKQIEVKGFELKNMRGTDGYLYLKDIVVSRNNPPAAVIEHKKMNASGVVRKVTGRFDVGDDVYVATGNTRMEAYRDFIIAPDGIVPDMDGQLGYVRFLNGITLAKGDVYGDSTEDDMRRIQIRETIASHLQKEEKLFYRGIKCLSLFFIDEVAKYRAFDEGGAEQTIGYGKVFEEEYEAAVHDRLKNPTTDDIVNPAYVNYLSRFDAHDVHRGYFSIDKKGNNVESKKEKKTDKENGIGLNDDDAIRAYDLILKNKEQLLSFEEPTRFIFSHSALREGWDNPNVFQICTLKHSDSETGKRQEVGRGLRLCVDKDGERQDLATLGEGEVHRVNVLTVIASESYSDFVADLQKDIKSQLRDRPIMVDNGLFAGRTIQHDDGIVHIFTEKEAGDICYFLVSNGYLDRDKQPTDKFRNETPEQFVYELTNFDAELAPYQTEIKALVESVYNPNAIEGMFRNGNEKKVTENRLNDNFNKAEFQELWKRINKKHAYTVSFDDQQLRSKSIDHINNQLSVTKLQYAITIGEQKVKANRDELQANEHFRVRHNETHDLDVTNNSNVTYDLVGEIASAASITRRSAAAILQGINADKFAMFKENPEEFIAKVGRSIVAEKATMIVEHITYHTLEDTYDSQIFTQRMPESQSHVLRSAKNIQDYVVWDSLQEKSLAETMDAAAEVCVYARLPRSFRIPTPVGNYAPDWAIAFNEGMVKHVYFIAETKGTMDTLELKGVENAKIACAKKLFNEMSSEDVRYHEVASYDDLLRVIKMMA